MAANAAQSTLEVGLAERAGRAFSFFGRTQTDTREDQHIDAHAEAELGHEASQSDDLFRVFVLGTTGAGKTAFLASMYNKLAVQDPRVGYFLDVPDYQRKILTRTFQRLADPNKDWPRGTLPGEVSEWVFTCAHASPSGTLPLFSFHYLDYSGELLTDTVKNQIIEPSEKAQSANSILVLLDGQKVLSFVAGEHQDEVGSLRDDLEHMVPILQRLSDKPLHFVISKWDVLEKVHSLDVVREKLLQHPMLRLIVDQRRGHAIPVRLIPVSALGPNFAELSEDGVMVKRADAERPTPFYVEMPIACTLIDALRNVEVAIVDEEDGINKSSQPAWKLLINIARGAIWTFQTVAGIAPVKTPHQVGLAALAKLLSALDNKLEAVSTQLTNEFEQALEDVKSRSEVVQAILQKSLFLMAKLEDEFPSSNLLH